MIGKKILVIDDDPDFQRLTGLTFKEVGAQAFTAYNGLEGINKVFTHHPDLIILDVMIPGSDGYAVCHKIRQFSNTPIIIISALDQDENILQGLHAGADGYLSKPFKPEILLATAEAVMRRSEQSSRVQTPLNYNDEHLKIDIKRHRVKVKNKAVKLTPVEFKLLDYLVDNIDKVLTFEQILFNVWGNTYQGNKDYVHVYISHLRRKIEPNPKTPRYIQSVHGIGYLFEGQAIGRSVPI